MLGSALKICGRRKNDQPTRWWLNFEAHFTIISQVLFLMKEDIGAVFEQSLELGVLVNLLLPSGAAALLLLFPVAHIRAHMNASHVADEDKERCSKCDHSLSSSECDFVLPRLLSVNDRG